MVEELGIESEITFTGTRADMREIYAISTLVLSLSSQPESFGRTVLEALSLGVPVVGYDHGGVGEILHTVYPHGLVVLGKPQRLLDRVESMLQSRPPVPERHPFELARMLDQTVATYETLCAANRGRPVHG